MFIDEETEPTGSEMTDEQLDAEIEAALAEESEEVQTVSEEDTTDWKAEALKNAAISKRLFNKLKTKPPTAPVEKTEQPINPPKTNAEEVDEKILRATKGYSDDTIDELKFIAERQGISLFAAEASDRFKRYVDSVQEEQKKAEASLGASKGSNRKPAQPSFSDPNLTADQHRELARKMGIV